MLGSPAGPGCSRSRRPISQPADRSHRPEMAGAHRPETDFRSPPPAPSRNSTHWLARRSGLQRPLIDQCCRAFLASFKIWKTATVGGNLCMALPAGPMIALTAALDGDCVIWRPTAASGVCRSSISCRAPAQCARARRTAAPDQSPECRADAAHGLPTDLAVAARPLGRVADRHARAARWLHADHHRLDAAAGATAFDTMPSSRYCAKPSCSAAGASTTTCTARRTGGPQ